jgi:hypothetical protein
LFSIIRVFQYAIPFSVCICISDSSIISFLFLNIGIERKYQSFPFYKYQFVRQEDFSLQSNHSSWGLEHEQVNKEHRVAEARTTIGPSAAEKRAAAAKSARTIEKVGSLGGWGL